MPTVVLGLLVVLVGLYVVLAGAAWMGFLRARRQPEPPPPSDWPSVSVVVSASMESPEAAMRALQDCSYPPERLDVVLLHTGSVEPSFGNAHGDLSVHPVSVDAQNRDERGFKKGVDVARGAVVLKLPPGGMKSTNWIRAMVRHCTADAPVVVGPTVVEHDDLFLPRLQALQHLNRQAFSGGLSQFGFPPGPVTQNRAIRPHSLSPEQNERYEPLSRALLHTALADFSAGYIPDPDAVVRQSPVSSFTDYVRWQAQWLARSFHFPAWLVQGRAAGLWLLHTVLLACSVVAVGLPSWRQPTLLALVGKMGADVILTLPAAKLYGQRGLLRSIVATILMQVVTLPLAGLWLLVEPASSADSRDTL
jgi:hypothetical protein